MRLLLPILLAATLSVAAADLDLNVDTVMRGHGLAGHPPADLRWAPDGSKVWFSWKQWNDPVEKERGTWVVNRDGSGLRKLSDEEAKDAMPSEGERTRDKQRVVYIDDGDVYLWEARTARRRALTSTTETESNPHLSHDERSVTFVRANNLFVLSLAEGTVEQLTNIVSADEKGSHVTLWDDKKGTASQEYVKSEERKLIDYIDRMAKKREEDKAREKREHPRKPLKLEKDQTVNDLRLTPDRRFVVLLLTRENSDAKKPIVPNYVTEAAYTETIPSRTKVGDLQNTTRIGVLDATNGDVKWLEHGLVETQTETPPPQQREGQASAEKTEKSEATQTEAAKAKERDVTLGAPIWSEDGKRALMMIRSADNEDLWIMRFDPVATKTETIATMHDDAWVRNLEEDDSTFGWVDNDRFYYHSEATGFLHLYTSGWSGGAPRQLTAGNWEVLNTELSRDRKNFHLITNEGTPFERHLYRLPVTGGARTKLTTTVGNHSAVVSPDGSAIADVYSYTNKPPELYLGPMKVTSSPAPEFWTYPWLDVPIVRIPARDGAQVPARIYKPANYARGGKAVIFVHGAGYLQNVHRWWSNYFREYMFHHILVSRGYLVLDLDFRASAGYGRDWRTAIYRHMGGKDLTDQIDAARWMVSEHGVDPKRIGIYGGSYGGFITLMALFTEPDVFAAGAALRPVTDWAHYNHPYTSNILNEPQTDPEAYRRSSPIYFAAGLKNDLLICHGMVDTNVHYQDSVRLAQRLIEMRKTGWELASYPVESHAFLEPTSWADEYKRILKLFEGM